MHLLNSQNTWQLRIDFPEELQFAAYIGQQEKFRPEGKGEPSTGAEYEWRLWWQNLEMPLIELPLLEKLRQRHRDEFSLEWHKLKMALVQKQLAQLEQAKVQAIVRDCQILAHKQYSDFELRLDFVFWPENYERIVSKNYLILGGAYLEQTKTAELKEILQRQIAGLV